ncbi:DUF695 domain-containing protein [Hyunsoonleella sp. SJ7]|uniref:DUF695 domain-containing protein n=1 Tax=Hyunsoonleella aquatilis TaxID=2762758 RepID=A0A923KND1_9FLAO|nr:DUF695 domain-containing protein [Hyunsoonleella aquatilis]MBC3760025.1 DUF695 domain-containing protein [Hyunsoonleella aquatilis]
MIPKEEIVGFFDRMKSNGVDTNTKMLYGYFFTNDEPKKLEIVAEELKKQGFEYVDIYPDETNQYWLHMERIEIHNSESLFNLNKELYAIADKFSIKTYDGFDVGNVDKTKGIERDTYVVPEEFKSNDFEKDGSPFLVIANSAFDNFPHKTEFSNFIEITSNYTLEDTSKMPNEIEYAELDELDVFIENNLNQNGIKSYYVGRTTFGGERKIYFVTNDKDGANGLMDFLKENGNKRAFEFKIIEDAKWNLYEEIKVKLNKK